MVRLKVEARDDGPGQVPGFNSIVVRLKALLLPRQWHGVSAFQFHSGSIKRCAVCQEQPGVSGFQFHSGSIKSLWVNCDVNFFSSVSIP